MAKYYVFWLLVCDVCVGSKALSILGGLILYLFKQLLEERQLAMCHVCVVIALGVILKRIALLMQECDG